MNTNTKKTPGQIAFESVRTTTWDHLFDHEKARWDTITQAVLASQWRSVDDPPEDERTLVVVGGGQKDAQGPVQFCARNLSRSHWMKLPPLPQPPINPYAELKAAHEAGKVIQLRCGSHSDNWVTTPDPDWTAPVTCYRIKPWELTRHIPGFRPLEDGEEWHRLDFTEEMLPEGWRPAILNEVFGPNECHFRTDSGVFLDPCGTAYNTCHQTRTRRPLPPTKAEQERAEFEERAINEGVLRLSDEDLPRIRLVDTAWAAWQAARATKNT